MATVNPTDIYLAFGLVLLWAILMSGIAIRSALDDRKTKGEKSNRQ